MYITNANLDRILSKIEHSSADINDLLAEFNKLDGKLSESDRKKLAAAKYFLSNENLDNINITKFNPIRPINNPYFVFSRNRTRPPAYHQHQNCSRLEQPFSDLAIPRRVVLLSEEISQKQGQEIGEKILDEYQKFFTDCASSMTEKVQLQGAIMAVITHFLDKYNLHLSESEIWQEINQDNSGAAHLQNTQNPKETLDNTLEQYHNFLLDLQSSVKKEITQIYDWRFADDWQILRWGKDRADPEITRLAEQLAQHKKNLMGALISYLKFKADFKQDEIDKTFLERLGFVPCGECRRNSSFRNSMFNPQPSHEHINSTPSIQEQDIDMPF